MDSTEKCEIISEVPLSEKVKEESVEAIEEEIKTIATKTKRRISKTLNSKST